MPFCIDKYRTFLLAKKKRNERKQRSNETISGSVLINFARTFNIEFSMLIIP